MFKEIKRIVARDHLLAYPYFNKRIEMYTDASNFQIVVVIRQKVKMVAFYSITLNGPQKHLYSNRKVTADYC